MHAKTKTGLILLGVVIIGGFILILNKKSFSNEKRTLPKPIVVAGNMKFGQIVLAETLTGDILPEDQANIFSKVNGNIEKMYADIGDKVTGGQILALIDTTIYSQNARQAKANYMQAVAGFENAKLGYERNKQLFSKNLISQQDLDNSKAAYDVANAQKEAASATMNNAVTQLGYCKIRAPFSGTITKRMLDPGAYVTSSATSQSSVIFTLMNISRLKITVNVPEKIVPYLKSIHEVIITADALPDQNFVGEIGKISQYVDLSTRTMAVEIQINDPSGNLKPGMFATATFILEKKDNVALLPTQVVLSDDYGNYVFVINPDTTVTRKYIETGIKTDTTTEIMSGIRPDEKVVVIGQSLVKDNMKVRISK